MGYDSNEQITVLIGDIHGCYQELRELLTLVGWNEENEPEDNPRVILLGDLVDRGPDSGKCVSFARTHGFECVRGNHDDRYVKYRDRKLWHSANPNNPLPAWMKKYPERVKILESLSEADLDWIAALPTKIFLRDYGVMAVHAGFLPGVPLDKQEENTLMHVRFLFDRYKPAHLDPNNDHKPPPGSKFWAEDYDGEWDVVYGHHVWNYEDIKIHHAPNGKVCIGIDTGCCFGGKLTALELSKDKQHKIHQVKSRKPPKPKKQET